MVKKLIEIDGRQVRFAIDHNGERKKLFTIFNAASDVSLAFHSYNSAKGIGEITSDSAESGQSFNLKDAKYSDFEIFKFNFHKSGTGNVKNKSGERPSADYQSIAFDKIKDAANLMVYQPTHFDKYPTILDNKDYIDLIQGDESHIPPNVQIILSKKGFDIKADFVKHQDSLMFIHRALLVDFDLNLCINVRQHSTKIFPELEYIASITY